MARLARYKSSFWFAVLFLEGVACVDISVTKTNKGENYTVGELIFEDNFDYLDLEVWNHEITLGGNSHYEFQLYHNSRKTSFIKGCWYEGCKGKCNCLHIKPGLTEELYGFDAIWNEISLEGGSPVDSCTNPSFQGCYRRFTYPNMPNPVMSARLRTVNSFYFQYGRVEVRAKLPGGDWLWPAIWMMPRFNQYGPWPASGEIDIMESRGNKALYDPWRNLFGSTRIGSTLHFGPAWNHDGYEKMIAEKTNPNGYDTDFHVYTLFWNDERISIFVDNVGVKHVVPDEKGFWKIGEFDDSLPNPWKNAKNKRMAPFDHKFYLILNVAVGGMNNYFPDHWTNGEGRERKPWRNNQNGAFLKFYEERNKWLPTWEGDRGAMIVDYVRVYAV